MSRPPEADFWPRPRPRALFAGLALGVGISIAASAMLSPILFPWLDGLEPGRFPFRRVLRRLAELVALVLLVAGLRHLGVRRLAQVGLGWSRRRGRQAALGALMGAAVMAGALAIEFGTGVRIQTGTLSALGVLHILGASTLIALLEEGLCRGALLFPFGRLRGATQVLATVYVSGFFALAHFARGGARAPVVDWGSGWRLWAEVPRAALHYHEAFLGLFLVGILLYQVARRQGHAWGVVGIHAGGVAALQLGGALGDVALGAETPFFVDGLLPGYRLSALVALAITLVVLRREPTS